MEPIENTKEASGSSGPSITGASPIAIQPMADLRRNLVVISIGIFVTSLAQPDVLGLLPLRFLLKNHLGLTPQAMAGFFAIGGFPWYLKPLAGLLSDSIPLFGTRRRYYLLLSSLIAGLLWGVMAFVPKTYYSLLAVVVLLNVMLMMASSVVGGLLVEESQKNAATGRLSTIRILVTAVSIVVAGAFGGFLATQSFLLTSTFSMTLLVLLAGVAFILLHEPKVQSSAGALKNASDEIGRIFRFRPFWLVAGVLFLVMISPGFATPLFYYQTNVLKFSSQFLGTLRVAMGLFGLIGGITYYYLCKRIPVRFFLVPTILAHVIVTLFFLAYRTQSTALAIECLNGLTLSLAVLPLFDIATRATPSGSAALGYAVLVSVFNIALALSDVLGSWLFGHYHLDFVHLVWLNAATTALVLPAIRFLPLSLTNHTDSQARLF